jgi:hypothetical protein
MNADFTGTRRDSPEKKYSGNFYVSRMAFKRSGVRSSSSPPGKYQGFKALGILLSTVIVKAYYAWVECR